MSIRSNKSDFIACMIYARHFAVIFGRALFAGLTADGVVASWWMFMMTTIGLVIASVAFLLVEVLPARAESYRVDYAVKVKTGEAAGAVSCRYDQRCVVDLNTLQMHLEVSISGGYRDRAKLVLNGKDGCCLFEGATRWPSLDLVRRNWRLRLFTGEEARGLEYIQNEPIGTLYLRFNLGDPDRSALPFWQRSPI